MKTELPSLGQYKLQQRLGGNGISEVWKAYDSNQRRAVIVKFYHADPSNDADTLQQYLNNIDRIASLHHPNIVPIQDIHVLPSHSPNGSPSLICFTMPYIQRESLPDYIRSITLTQKIPPPPALVALFSTLS